VTGNNRRPPITSRSGTGRDGTAEVRLAARETLDIFEGTQQIQQLIVARRLLGKSSAELR